MRRRNILLIGFMGSGKSSVAKALTVRMSPFRLVDVDAQIEAGAGMPISQIFEGHGEAYFRDLETKQTSDVCAGDQQIISTGGGVILREENRTALKAGGIVFWLVASANITYERIKDETQRPLINTGASREEVVTRIETIFQARFDWYNEVADVIINTDNMSVEQIAADIQAEYERLIACLP